MPCNQLTYSEQRSVVPGGGGLTIDGSIESDSGSRLREGERLLQISSPCRQGLTDRVWRRKGLGRNLSRATDLGQRRQRRRRRRLVTSTLTLHHRNAFQPFKLR